MSKKTPSATYAAELFTPRMEEDSSLPKSLGQWQDLQVLAVMKEADMMPVLPQSLTLLLLNATEEQH